MLFLVAMVAGWARFDQLGRAALRADEINAYLYAARGVPPLELWRNPPWLNQIPVVDMLYVAVLRMHADLSEWALRWPAALMGLATVLLCCGWTARKYGLAAGLLAGIWMALHPYHVYESREAYYYAPAMLGGAGLGLYTLGLAARVLSTRRAAALRAVAVWALLCAAACLTHMSVWPFAALTGAALLTLLFALSGRERRRHALGMLAGCMLVALVMARWVWRGLREIIGKYTGGPEATHVGAPWSEVAPGVLPNFMGAHNWVGWTILTLGCAAALFVAVDLFRRRAADREYCLLGGLALGALGLQFVYVGALGGGVGKLTYFSAVWPVFLVWSAVTLDRCLEIIAAKYAAGRWRGFAILVVCLLLSLVFLPPVRAIIRLDGKPTPYRQVVDWIEANMPPGSVMLVDRWLEPWNEMLVYRPANAVVTFTIPDEPFAFHQEHRWRDVTREYIKSGRAQGFIRLTRLHADRLGIWHWPERHYPRRVSITNQPGMWLRETRFAPVEGFYRAHTNRLVVDIFYELPEDLVARRREQGAAAVCLLGKGWGYAKPWRETGRFEDYRVLTDVAELECHNLTGQPGGFTLTVRAAAMPDDKTVRLDDAGTVWRFPARRIVEHQARVQLQPGANTLRLRHFGPEGAGSVLWVADVSLVPADTSPPGAEMAGRP